MRSDNRANDELRQVSLKRHFTKHAEGSVLACFGDTQVLCTASVLESVPRFLKGSGRGWVTAEYGMLPRSTHSRMDREAARGKQSGRTQEIQRLIGRSLRGMLDLKLLGETSITVDCDVIQADGGTRTAAITGSAVAVIDALKTLAPNKPNWKNIIQHRVAAISVGMIDSVPVLDLNYIEDSSAETDMNVVMNDALEFIEIQGTAEGIAFKRDQLDEMLTIAQSGIEKLFKLQMDALET